MLLLGFSEKFSVVLFFVFVLPVSNGTVFPASTRVSLDNELAPFYRRPRSGGRLLTSVSASRGSWLHVTQGHELQLRLRSSTCLEDGGGTEPGESDMCPAKAPWFQLDNLLFLHLGEGRKISFNFKRLE